MALKDISGQEQALRILTGSIKRNRIAHAYLFSGEDGIGKKLTAVNVAKVLNCQNNHNELWKENNEAHINSPHASHILHDEIDCCDNCPSCKKINTASHPDVFFIASPDNQIKVDVIRELRASLSYKAFEGKWKVVIIDEADKLNQSAVNAFLKTLEEPSQQSLIMLISSKPELIPETIHSRCQRINFLPLPLSKMNNLLEHRLIDSMKQMKRDEAMITSMLSGGRPGYVMSDNLVQKRDALFAEFKTLIRRADENCWGGRDTMEEWFEWVHLWLRDAAVLKATGNASLLINYDREKELAAISKNAALNDILELSDTFYSLKRFLRFNLNKRVTLQQTHLLLKKTFGRINA
jgi:DNA polymerase-3 subunit delta'